MEFSQIGSVSSRIITRDRIQIESNSMIMLNNIETIVLGLCCKVCVVPLLMLVSTFLVVVSAFRSVPYNFLNVYFIVLTTEKDTCVVDCSAGCVHATLFHLDQNLNTFVTTLRWFSRHPYQNHISDSLSRT